MNQLTLQWIEAGQAKTAVIRDGQASKHPGTVRLGRDPVRCDIVLQHPTVSGLHVEIFFNLQQGCFCLRSLRPSNPPMINQHQLTQGDAVLQQNTVIRLGQVDLQVVAIALGGVAPTLVVPTSAPPTIQPIPPTSPLQTPTPLVAPTPATYGLECPKCHKVSPYENLRSGCPWCGASLAAAPSVLVVPDK
jgi:predicted component of type VI protein secretion system